VDHLSLSRCYYLKIVSLISLLTLDRAAGLYKYLLLVAYSQRHIHYEQT
jgi:hypothetical protein